MARETRGTLAGMTTTPTELQRTSAAWRAWCAIADCGGAATFLRSLADVSTDWPRCATMGRMEPIRLDTIRAPS